MQTDTPQFRRSKKYDTYVSGDLSARQNILPMDEQPVSYTYAEPIATYQPVEPQQSSYYPPEPVAFKNPITTPSFSAGTFKSPKINKKKSKKPALATIMKATVQLEKVTKSSISVVKQTFEPDELNALRTKKQKILARSFYAVGLASFLLLIGFGSRQIFGGGTPQASRDVLGVQTTGAKKVSNEPVEQKPSEQDMKTYLVAPQYPRYLRIPKIGIDSRVRRLGVDSKGAVAFPANIYDIGWYDGSVLPGDKDGASVLIGHLMGTTQQGVLWNIEKLSTGDSIEVEKGNGTIVRYRVNRVQKIQPEDDLSTFLTPEVAGKHDLKILTASGMYDKVNGNTQQRTAVYASEI